MGSINLIKILSQFRKNVDSSSASGDVEIGDGVETVIDSYLGDSDILNEFDEDQDGILQDSEIDSLLDSIVDLDTGSDNTNNEVLDPLKSLLATFFNNDEIRQTLDSNSDGTVDALEKENFISNYSNLDGESSDFSLNDLLIGLSDNGVDVFEQMSLDQITALFGEEAAKAFVADDNVIDDSDDPDDKTPFSQTPYNQMYLKMLSDPNSIRGVKSAISDERDRFEAIQDGTDPEVVSAKTAMDTAEVNMNKAIESDENIDEQLAQDIKDKISQIDDTEDSISQEEGNKTETETYITETGNSISNIEKSVWDIDDILEGVLESISSLQYKLAHKAEDDTTDYQGQINVLESKKTALNIRKTDLQSAKTSTETKLDGYNKDIDDINDRLDGLGDKLSGYEGELAALTTEKEKGPAQSTLDAISAYRESRSSYKTAQTTARKNVQTNINEYLEQLKVLEAEEIQEGNDLWLNIAEETGNLDPSEISRDYIREVYEKHRDILNGDIGLAYYGSQVDQIERFQEHYDENIAIYEKVSEETGIPPELIAAIHWKEAGGKFDRYLHNGDPLGKETVHVPAGIYFDNWEEAAIDALKSKGYVADECQLTSDSTDMAAMLTYAESYNGLGYHYKDTPSGYIYPGTDICISGNYISDGVYDKDVVNQCVGVLALLSSIMD